MKHIAYGLIIMFCILTSGCVSRTVTESKGTRSPETSNGPNPTAKVVETKTIWFWQDDFRKP